ncbi:MAG TPA: hypothetical protein VKY73_16065 [Polyangiaceae bacterium]|nr:hypothetical protein [Polyangiaceae bacterium]
MTTSPPSEAPLERVELVEGEHIVARGSVEVAWLVAVRDGWLPAARAPGARVQTLPSGPGTVWQRVVELELPRGTRLVRVESRPRSVQRTPLEHLQRGAGPARRVLRRSYQVGKGGAVRPQEPT